MSLDLRLLAILDPAMLGGRDILTAARAAQEGGATIIQLRMKDSPADAVYDAALRLRTGLKVPLFINDRADVALVSGAAGVHLGQDDLPPESFQTSGRALSVGLSVGSIAEAETALRAQVDYWSIGPLYRTASKADAGVPLGPAGFAALARLAPTGMPVIAIGGMTMANVGEVIRAGAAGVATISAVFAARDIAQAARKMRHGIDQALERRAGRDGD